MVQRTMTNAGLPNILYVLWDKAQGQEGYDKAEWNTLVHAWEDNHLKCANCFMSMHPGAPKRRK